ncbi:MAG: M48 family metalloprotease [Rickettsiales bacterium]|nr:M48 family metalloprotease [Rickettsiales bacterium]
MLKKIFYILIFLLPEIAFANLKVIRDSETEHFISKISKPIFIQAGLNEDDIGIHIINDDSLNAFVAGGRNLFINSGLIIRADTIEALLGVIAHEVGHIAGGHLVKLNTAADTLSTSLALGYILGIATAVSGNPDVGQALLLGSSHVADRSMLKFSRNHEDASDEAALKYLNNLNIDPNGMLSFFEQIKANESFSSGGDNLYTRSHPLTDDRIIRIKSRIQQANNQNYKNYSDSEIEEFEFIKIKLESFLVEDPETSVKKITGDSKYDYYAKAILFHRMGNLKMAVKNLDYLLNKDPKNQYLIELKAQFFYENGEPNQALKFYKKANAIDPKDLLIKMQIAESIISIANPGLYDEAINEIKEVLLEEYFNVNGWIRLSYLYDKIDKPDLSLLALAESKYYSGRYIEAVALAEEALENFEKDTKSSNNHEIFRSKEIIDFSNRKISEDK